MEERGPMSYLQIARDALIAESSQSRIEEGYVPDELSTSLRCEKSEVCEQKETGLTDSVALDRLVAEMMDRVAEAFPAGCDISEQDWRRLDVIHERINAARRRRGLTDLRDQIAQYESTALEVARGTILAPQEGIR